MFSSHEHFYHRLSENKESLLENPTPLVWMKYVLSKLSILFLCHIYTITESMEIPAEQVLFQYFFV